MFWLPEIRRLFRLPVRRPATVAAEVDGELEFHLLMRCRELEALGFSPEEARAEAVRRFGDVEETRRSLVATDRRAGRIAVVRDWVTDFIRDVRFAGRELRRNRSFAVVAVVVLGLGIGLTTAIVSVFDRLALHPLPYPNADRLGTVFLAMGQGGHTMRLNPDQAVRDAVAGTPGVARVDTHQPQQVMVELDGTPEVVAARLVTPGMLPGLGARAALGRLFAPEDTAAGSPLTTLLAEGTWKRWFGGDQAVLGRSVRIDGRLATIIGVVARGFDLTSLDGDPRAEFWLPFRRDLLPGDGDRAHALVTLAPGAGFEQVAFDIDARVKAAAAPASQFAKNSQAVLLSSEAMVSQSLRGILTLLVAAVGLVLLVACSNVAALLLGQALTRIQEFGVREALGAGRGRVVRQLVAESALLGGLGLAVGIGVSAAALALVQAVRPAKLLTIDEVHLGWTTMAIAAAVALGAVLAFGLAPIWAVTRANAAAALVGRTQAGGRSGAGRLRSGLVVSQVAVTLVLLLGAGLLLKSFVRERVLPLGFEPDGLGVVAVSVPEREFPTREGQAQLIDEIADRIRQLPGVRAITLAGNSPVDFGVLMGEFLPEGQDLPAEVKTVMPMRSIRPDYFSVTGMSLVAGRSISLDSSAREIVIDESTARRVWGGLNVIGRRVRFSRSADDWQTVVGVAADVRGLGREFPGVPTLYTPAERGYATTLLVRMADVRVLGAVSRAVRDGHPGVRIRSAATVPALLDEQLAGTRFTLVIVGWFAILALTLAMVGLYGVIGYAVRQRQFEFGVRLALGAAPPRVRAMVLREGLSRVGGGIVLGMVGSLGAVRVIRGMLFEMSPWDPWVFGVTVVILIGVGTAAVWIPAQRASQTDPLAAIRAE